MVIRGLFTFIVNDRYKKYLDDYQLTNTPLIIDGWNVACYLYTCMSKTNCCFGGDYDRYYNFIMKFFERLIDCRVRPLVVLCGGWKMRTKKMMLQKAERHMKTSQAFQLSTLDNDKFHPALERDVFLDVLKKMQIKYVMCPFEPDSTIVAACNKLQCPVLTMDSDYFIYGVNYIPITTLRVTGNLIGKDLHGSHVMPCKIYRVEKLTEIFRGLQVSFLPLMSVLVGDHGYGLLFKDFFNITQPSKSPMEENCRKIEAAFKWLTSFSTIDDAIAAILRRIPEEKKKQITTFIQNTIKLHSAKPLTEVLHYLGLNDTSDMENIKSKMTKVTIDKRRMRKEINVPQWFIEIFITGNLHTCFINMILQQSYILPLQIEDFHYNSPHEITIDIIRAIYRLLITVNKCGNENILNLTIRERNKLQLMKLNVEKSSLPLEAILKLDLNQRMVMINDVLGIRVTNKLEILPENWRLYVATAVYWMKREDKPVKKQCHLDALLCCMLFGIIDKKLGFQRYEPNIRRQYSTIIKKIKRQNKFVDQREDVTINEAVERIDVNDCVMAALFFLPRFANKIVPNIPKDGRVKPIPKEFWITTVHIYTQFQCCLRQFLNFNALLGGVYSLPIIGELFNGSLVYNLYEEFAKQPDVDDYVTARLKFAPGFIRIFKMLKKNVNELIELS